MLDKSPITLSCSKMLSLSFMPSTAILLLLTSLVKSNPSPNTHPSLITRNDPNNHPSEVEWHCDPYTKQDTVCVDMSQSTSAPWQTPETFPGYNSRVDACWSSAYHVKARHRIQYKGENSTSTSIVTLWEATAIITRRSRVVSSAEKNEKREWTYTRFWYEGADNDLKLRFEDFCSAKDFVEIRGEWIDWDCPFEQRSPIQELAPLRMYAGIDIGSLETGPAGMVNPFYER